MGWQNAGGWQGGGWGRAAGGGGGAGATATWNPADTGLNITLSNGNLTATSSSTTNFTGRATRSASTGIKYFEFTYDVYPGNGIDVGVCDGSLATSGNIFDSFGRATIPNTAFTLHNDGTFIQQPLIQSGGVGFAPVSAQSTPIGLMIDLTNQLFWITLNGSTWAAGGGTFASPGAGLAYTGITAGTVLYPAFSLPLATAKITANFGGASYAFGLPSSASNW